MSKSEEKTRILSGNPFQCAVNGPDVAVSTLYPIVEHGAGWLRVKALAVSADYQEEIVEALQPQDFRRTLVEQAVSRFDDAVLVEDQRIREQVYDDIDASARLLPIEVERAAQNAITVVLNALDRVGVIQALQAFPETLDLYGHVQAPVRSFEDSVRAMLVLSMIREMKPNIDAQIEQEFSGFGDFDTVIGVASDVKGWIEEFEQFDEISPSSAELQALIDGAANDPDALIDGLRSCRDALSSRQGFAAARDVEQALEAIEVLSLKPRPRLSM